MTSVLIDELSKINEYLNLSKGMSGLIVKNKDTPLFYGIASGLSVGVVTSSVCMVIGTARKAL